ncbi:Clusterin-associated protein 1 [Kappamyces sp. JEL0829]|nr:Clusterin-associated protein 1 [Kappamyces sp. JEL0829]
MEAFRTPNFDLMSKLLYWLINNYDPRFTLALDFSTEANRVQFVKTVAAFIAPKAQIHLNTRNLYKADGSAVRELLKITALLEDAKDAPNKDVASTPPLEITSKLAKLKACRGLATEITERGAELYDLLGHELELREVRNQVISKPFELMAIEKDVNEAVDALQEKLKATLHAFENLQADEANLVAKIEKKKQEYDRAEKRLRSLQGVRPAYMDEYEKIEAELVKVYEVYMEKFRNLAYLEQQLDEYNREEQNRFDETESSLRRMQNRLREEELELLRGEKQNGSFGSLRPNRPAGADESDSDDDSDDDEDEGMSLDDSDESSGEVMEEGEGGSSITIDDRAPVRGARPTQAASRRSEQLDDDDDEDDSVELGDDDDDEDLDDNDF